MSFARAASATGAKRSKLSRDRAIDVAAGETFGRGGEDRDLVAMRRAARAARSPSCSAPAPDSDTPGARWRPASTSAVSAICGIHFGDTKLPASIGLETGIGEPFDERDLDRGGNRRGLVLQPVARPDLDHAHALRQIASCLRRGKGDQRRALLDQIAGRVIARPRPCRRRARRWCAPSSSLPSMSSWLAAFHACRPPSPCTCTILPGIGAVSRAARNGGIVTIGERIDIVELPRARRHR